MNSAELREKFLEFFEKKGHKIVASSSLLPTDPTVLFTTAGMQQFKDYYLGEPSPYGNRVVSCQKCFRTSDIEKVGDGQHLTFLEMLGNFSFNNDYFKKEAISWAFEFLTSELQLPTSKLWLTFFKGNKDIPEDKESQEIWQGLGIARERIFGFGRENNFWGPTGKEGPCGPTTEIHYDLTGKPCKKGKECRPNCDCGRFVEIWNLVFNEYYQNENGKLSPLEKKGVDTGMGLERLAQVVQGEGSVFETDLFLPIISKIKEMMKIKKAKGSSSFSRLFMPSIALEEEKEKLSSEIENLKYIRVQRIIGDHIKGAVFLASEGVFPSNLEQGYVLRRILRRAIRYGKLLNLPEDFLIPLAQEVIKIYKDVYPEVKLKETDILTIIQKEGEKFRKTLEKGLKQFEKLLELQSRKKLRIIKGKEAFDLYQSYGFPLELTEELARERGFRVEKEDFYKAQKEHQRVSRAGFEKKFGGLGIEKLKAESEKLKVIKLHTATHLLHQALREVLGKHVKQMGSDITPERLRFDFTHPAKMTAEELQKVEDLVNEKIKEDLKVEKREENYQEALKSGALAFFKEKYPERVKVYSIGNFSKEICAGPHVKRTSELGHFKILKEESSAAGVRRIRAVLEKS